MLSLAQALSPAFFRVGGTEADKLWYDLEDCFSVDHCKGRASNFKEAVSRESLVDFFSFAQKVGYKTVFGLNAVVGPRDEHGHWVADNAAALIAFAAKNFPNTSGWWELGNEPEAFVPFQHKYIGASDLLRDIKTLRQTLLEVAPTHKLAGIDSFGNPPFAGPDGLSFLPGFLKEGGSDALDAITYHWYPLLGNCGGAIPIWACKKVPGFATLEKAVTTAFTDTEEKLKHMQSLVSNTGKPLWLGEGALAAAGGRDGVTNRFASSLFYLFELGQAAITGHSVVLRQCLSGAAYSLIDINSQMPLSDYWAALLHKRLMGTQVHKADAPLPLRAFAHCHPSRSGHVTVLVVNPSGHSQNVSLARAAGTAVELHLLTAEDPQNPLASTSARINNKLMTTLDGVIPPIPVTTLLGVDAFDLPESSAAFFTFSFAPCLASPVEKDAKCP